MGAIIVNLFQGVTSPRRRDGGGGPRSEWRDIQAHRRWGDQGQKNEMTLVHTLG